MSLFRLYSPSYSFSNFYPYSQNFFQFLSSHFLLLYILPQTSILIHEKYFRFSLATLFTFIFFLQILSLFTRYLSVSLFPLYFPSYTSFHLHPHSPDLLKFLSSHIILLHILPPTSSFILKTYFSFSLPTLFAFIYFLHLLHSFIKPHSVSLFPLYSPFFSSSHFYTYSHDLFHFLSSHFIRLHIFPPTSILIYKTYFSFFLPSSFAFIFFLPHLSTFIRPHFVSLYFHFIPLHILPTTFILILQTSYSFCLPTLFSFIFSHALLDLFFRPISVSLFPLYSPSYTFSIFYTHS